LLYFLGLNLDNFHNRCKVYTVNIPEKADHLQGELDTIGVELYRPSRFVVTTDEHLARAFSVSMEHLPETPKDVTRAGLIIGDGALFSFAPELQENLDMVVMVDNNGFVSDWREDALQMMAVSDTPSRFLTNVVYGSMQHMMNRAFHSANTTPAEELEAAWRVQGDSTESYHFLSNQERFTRCKEALATLPIISAVVDLGNPEQVNVLNRGLTDIGARIPYANFTNVMEHNAHRFLALAADVETLPFTDPAVVMYSAVRRPSASERLAWDERSEPQTKTIEHIVGDPERNYVYHSTTDLLRLTQPDPRFRDRGEDQR
jgi:hypothetical protein